jgi:hypothetical protein
MTSADAFSKHFVSVNTRDRDCETWPSASDLELTLGEELRDVKCMIVRGYNIPDIYPVAQGRDTLWVRVGAETYEASAPVEYTEKADTAVFLEQMARALRAATGDASWRVGLDWRGHVTLSSEAAFKLIAGQAERRTQAQPNRAVLTNDGYGPRSAGRVMGFPRGGAVSAKTDGRHEVVAEFKHQFGQRFRAVLRAELK